MNKKLIISLYSIVVLVLFFMLPNNRTWFASRIIGYWNDFRQQKKHLGIEERKVSRWETDYTVSLQIAALLRKQGDTSHALVLLPPSAYFKDKKLDYHVPEPAVFYYYTGLKTTWINSPMAMQANWLVTASNGEIKLIAVTDKKALADSIRQLKIYPVAL